MRHWRGAQYDVRCIVNHADSRKASASLIRRRWSSRRLLSGLTVETLVLFLFGVHDGCVVRQEEGGRPSTFIFIVRNVRLDLLQSPCRSTRVLNDATSETNLLRNQNAPKPHSRLRW